MALKKKQTQRDLQNQYNHLATKSTQGALIGLGGGALLGLGLYGKKLAPHLGDVAKRQVLYQSLREAGKKSPKRFIAGQAGMSALNVGLTGATVGSLAGAGYSFVKPYQRNGKMVKGSQRKNKK